MLNKFIHLAGAILHFGGSHNISKHNSNSFNSSFENKYNNNNSKDKNNIMKKY